MHRARISNIPILLLLVHAIYIRVQNSRELTLLLQVCSVFVHVLFQIRRWSFVCSKHFVQNAGKTK